MVESGKNESGDVNDWRMLYPFQSHFAEVADGIRQHYIDEGASDNPVLMVHGNPTWSFYYHRLVSKVRTSGRAIAVDHVGCGLSDKPQRYDYTLETHIQNLYALVERLDLRNITLVGHDWGGAIGMGCLTRMPERFSRIVLLNTAAFPPPFFPWRIRVLQIPFLGGIAIQGLNVFAKAAVRMATERPGGLARAVRNGLLAPYCSWNNRVAVNAFVQDIPTRPSQPTWRLLEKVERSLAALKQPKLLVWGMRDWCFRPSCLEQFLKHWPDAQTLRLADAGHYVLLDEPNRVIDGICRFVKDELPPTQENAS